MRTDGAGVALDGAQEAGEEAHDVQLLLHDGGGGRGGDSEAGKGDDGGEGETHCG